MSLSPENIAALINEAVEISTEPLFQQLLELKKQVKALEQQTKEFDDRRGLKFAGLWREDQWYIQHDVVAHKGGMWISVVPNTRERPGDSRHWQLCVKQGQPGRDGRGGGSGRGPAIDAEREPLS